MGKLNNALILHDGYVEIIASNGSYKHSVYIDIEDIQKVGKVRISNTGYAYQCGRDGKSVAHIVMGHTSNLKTVVDHINGNSLDNRKSNLRIVAQQHTHNKKNFIRNNTRAVGISYRENGKYRYYRVSLAYPDKNSYNSKNRQGKRVVKQFNINKLGKQMAFSKAHEYLNRMKIKLGYLDSGSTTMAKASTLKRVETGEARKGHDIVWSI